MCILSVSTSRVILRASIHCGKIVRAVSHLCRRCCCGRCFNCFCCSSLLYFAPFNAHITTDSYIHTYNNLNWVFAFFYSSLLLYLLLLFPCFFPSFILYLQLGGLLFLLPFYVLYNDCVMHAMVFGFNFFVVYAIPHFCHPL